MANRFRSQYRPSHDGQNAYRSNWMSQNWIIPNHYDTTPRYDAFRITGDPKNPFNPYEDGFGFDKPSGGTKVPRKPKPQSPSGGMSLPLSTKVSL